MIIYWIKWKHIYSERAETLMLHHITIVLVHYPLTAKHAPSTDSSVQINSGNPGKIVPIL